MAILIFIAILLIGSGISFLLVAGAFKIVCFAFGLVFTWKIALGIWVIVAILQSVFSVRIKTKD